MSQHQQRPRDILEFLRRASSEEPTVDVAVPEPTVEPSSAPIPGPHVTVSSGDTPMVVLRRSQVVVACIAAGLLIILAFLLGLTTAGGEGGGDAASAPVRFYTIKAIEFDDTRNGEINAKSIKAELERRFDEEVTIQRLDRDRTIFVALGSWLENPKANRRATELLEEVRKLDVRGNEKSPFRGAFFFPIKR